MMPNDAYERKMEIYRNAIRQAEQNYALRNDVRFVKIPVPSLRQRLSNQLQWLLPRGRFHATPIVKSKLRFLILFLGFTAITLIAYA